MVAPCMLALWTLFAAISSVVSENVAPVPVFRLGSGAVAPSSPAYDYKTKNQPRQPDGLRRVQRVLMYCTPLLAIIALTMMVPGSLSNSSGGGGSRDFNYRIPPSWSPENEHNYSFRAFMTDISVWVMLTDLQPHQQCAALIMRLGGSAREMARMITPQEMYHGGSFEPGGEIVDPVTYLLGSLHSRFSALEEESSLSAMTEMMAFARRPGENVNSLIARYETVRQRAALEGQFVMTMPGCALQLIKACGMGPQHLFILLQPFQGRLPMNENQFRELCTQLRRYGHIVENAPGNIGSQLTAPPRQARPGAYHTQTSQQHLRDAFERSTSNQGAATFLSGTQAGTQGEGTWDIAASQGLLQHDPFASWQQDYMGGDHEIDIQYPAPGAGSSAAPCASAMPPDVSGSYAAVNQDDSDDDSSSMTSSDNGSDTLNMPDLSRLSDAEAAEQLFYQYRTARRTWRRFTGKPVRRFRRTFKKNFFKRGKGKGHPRGRGRGPSRGLFFTNDDVQVFLKGRGKGHRSQSFGKGHGRRKNPKGRDGEIMKCRICNSDEHLMAKCPRNTNPSGQGRGTSSSSAPSSFAGVANPLTNGAGTGGPVVSSAVTPPWSDDVFDAPREAFPSGASHFVQPDLPSSDPPAFYDKLFERW